MPRGRDPLRAIMRPAWVLIVSAACAAPPARTPMSPPIASEPRTIEALRTIERGRLRALVEADSAAAWPLHAEEFQVVNPLGRVSSRAQYLGGVAAGTTDYLTWETDSIAVRLYGNVAALRYQSVVEMTVRGQRRPRVRAWNTALYELRAGRWQIVWFHVTEGPDS